MGNPLGSGQTCAGRSLGGQLLEDGNRDQQGRTAPFYNGCIDYYGDNTGSFTVKATYSPSGAEDEDEGDEVDNRTVRASRADTEPKTCKLEVRISGKVIRRVCDKGSHCKRLNVVPVKGQQIELVRKKKTYEAQTNAKGEYLFRVKKGPYAVHLLGTTKKVEPDSRSGRASDDVPNLDFTLCKLPEAYDGPTPAATWCS